MNNRISYQGHRLFVHFVTSAGTSNFSLQFWHTDWKVLYFVCFFFVNMSIVDQYSINKILMHYLFCFDAHCHS